MAKPLLEIEKELAKQRMLQGDPTQKFGEGEALELFAKEIGSNPFTPIFQVGEGAGERKNARWNPCRKIGRGREGKSY